MKNNLLRVLLIAIFTMIQASFADYGGPRHPGYRPAPHHPGYRPAPYRPGYRPRPHYDDFATGIIITSCAPEVVIGNVSATDNVLINLANSKEFTDATKFKTEVNNIVTTEDLEVKMAKYFQMVDVKTSEDIAYFVGAREEEYQKYESIITENLDLNSQQAEIVVKSLVTTLKGNLN